MVETPDLRDIAYRVQSLTEKEAALERRISELEDREEALRVKRADDERRVWVAGIMGLGAIVMTLGGVLWAYRAAIFRGNP